MSYYRSNLRIASQCPFIKVYISQLCLAWFFKGVTKFSDEVVAFKIGLTVSVIFKRWIFYWKYINIEKAIFICLILGMAHEPFFVCLSEESKFKLSYEIKKFLWEMKLGPAPLLNIHDNSKNGYFHQSELSIFWSAYLN